MILVSNCIYARCFHQQRMDGNCRKFAMLKIEWICFNFDDIGPIDRTCLSQQGKPTEKGMRENLNMFYTTFGVMDISIGQYRKVDKRNVATVHENYNKM